MRHLIKSFRSFLNNPFLFIVLSASALWNTGGITSYLLFSVSLLLIANFFISYSHKNEETLLFTYLILFFFFLICISSAFHYSALNSLDPAFYITVKKHNAIWGIGLFNNYFTRYLLFPILLLALITLFISHKDNINLLTYIPIIFIPSMAVALYQGLIDLNFMNKSTRVSGLVNDFNGFGLSSYLIFPLCVLGFINSNDRWKKIGFFITALILFWCLLLTGSRTGFAGIMFFIFSFPIIYIWVNKKRIRCMPKYFLAVLTLTIVSLFIILQLFKQNTSVGDSILVKRMKESYNTFLSGGISEVAHNRFELGLQAFRLTASAPLAGWGPGGFIRNLDNIRFKNRDIDGVIFSNIKNKYSRLDNANNQYLQMSSEIGILGALINLALHIIPIWMVFSIRKRIKTTKERWTVGICSTVVCIMLILYLTGPHVLNVDVLMVMTVYLAFLFSTAVKYDFHIKTQKVKKPLIIFSLGLITILFVFGTYRHSFGSYGYSALQQAKWWPLKGEYGYYSFEKWNEDKIAWTAGNSSERIYAESNLFGLKVIALKYNSYYPDGLNVKLYLNETMLDEIHFFNGGVKNLYYYFPSLKGNNIYIKTSASKTFTPFKLNLSHDKRELGVALSQVSFLNIMPGDGVGFYHWESGRFNEISKINEDTEIKFRWTGMRATMNLQDESDNTKILFLKCNHPDINIKPVIVDVYNDYANVSKIKISNNKWMKLSIDNNWVKNSKALTFQVSRTWNPKLLGVSEDCRDLGVAVAVLINQSIISKK